MDYSSRKKTILVFLLFFLFILIILALNRVQPSTTSLLTLPRPGKSKTGLFQPLLTPAPSLPPSKLTPADQIVKKSIIYLNGQRRPGGFYQLHPTGEKTIKATNMWTALARLGYYQEFSRSPQSLAQAEKDAQIMISDCQANLDSCLATVYPLALLYQETQRSVYQDFLNQLGQRLLVKSYGQDVMALATQARQLAKLYELFGNQDYLKTARQRLAHAQLTAQAHQHRYQRGEDEACYIALAQTEIGKVGNDPKLLSSAQAFFQNQDYYQIPEQMTLIQPCIEAAFLLGQAIGEPTIILQGNQLLEKYVSSRWDGQGGFFQGPDKNQVNLTDTAYMIYLLGFEPNKQYFVKP